MIITRICPDCDAHWSQFEHAGNPRQDWLYNACPNCLERRRAKLREREQAVYGCNGGTAPTDYKHLNTTPVGGERHDARGRRVIRKSEPMGE